MAIETERRFLVDFEILCDSLQYMHSGIAQKIHQFYLSTDPDCTVRIRNINTDGIKNSYLTIKGRRENGSCSEVEFEIHNSKYDELALTGSCGISKKRFCHDVTIHGLLIPDLKWEIDVFDEGLKGLVIAEVEVPSIELPIDLPSWIGREITQDNQYSNSNLASLTRQQIKVLPYA